MDVIKYSYRRRLLDACLCTHEHLFKGTVLDVGGGGGAGRGQFYTPQSDYLIVLDRFPRNQVDIVGDARHIPIRKASINTVRLTEVLEHVSSPHEVCNEVARTLNPGGWLVCSTPFLEPIHGDPDDYWRLTPSAYKHLLGTYFQDIQIIAQGGGLTVVLEMVRRWILRSPIWLRYPVYVVLLPIMELLFWVEQKSLVPFPKHTTGFVCIAKRTNKEFIK